MPDLTREEVETIIARAENNSPALEEFEIRRLGTLALRQMDEIEAAQKLTSEVRRWEPCGHYGRYDEAECQVCVNVSARGRLVIERDAVVEQAQVAYEIFRKDGARLEADLTAARAALDRVEALARDWEDTANLFDARTLGGSAAGNTIRRMVGELRAAMGGGTIPPRG